MLVNTAPSQSELTHEDLSQRVVELALAGQTDCFEWHCLDQEIQRRLQDDYGRSDADGAVGRFRPVLVASSD